jgi:hemerythrin-like metal-binding protein
VDFRLRRCVSLLQKLRHKFSKPRMSTIVAPQGLMLSFPPAPYDLADDFKVGSAVVDSQHDRIFQLALKASNLARDPEDREQLQATFDEFGQALMEHFSYEEQILTNIQHPKLDEHVAQHQVMLVELESIRQRVASNGGGWSFQEEALNMLNFMLGVTVGHMLGSDLDCARELREIQPTHDS